MAQHNFPIAFHLSSVVIRSFSYNAYYNGHFVLIIIKKRICYDEM